ncbi:hypothetical protein EBB07_16580 [Paenibacillaceae bacterium]|nr:hypothetical protein EBB07_16580 [Paenibacillaceae bacterium]
MLPYRTFAITVILLIITVGCSSKQLLPNGEIDRIVISDEESGQTLKEVTDPEIISAVVNTLNKAHTVSTGAIDMAAPEYNLKFLSPKQEELLVLGYYDKAITLNSVTGRYWHAEQDQFYGSTYNLDLH